MQPSKLQSTSAHVPFISCRRAPRVTRSNATRSLLDAARSCSQEKKLAVRIGSLIAAAQIALLPFAGVSYADLDTKTEQEGLAATVEGSDISNEDQKSVLDKLQNKILPDAKQMLTKVGRGEGSNYPASIAKELETVDLEVKNLIKQANKGGDMSNIKSAASGIEQQINALKAIVGFD